MILGWSNISFRHKTLTIKEKLYIRFHQNLKKFTLQNTLVCLGNDKPHAGRNIHNA